MSPGVPLTVLLCGRLATICRVVGKARASRLAAFGVVPGAMVVKLRDHPVPVVRVEGTDLAVDRMLLGSIYVYRQERYGTEKNG